MNPGADSIVYIFAQLLAQPIAQSIAQTVCPKVSPFEEAVLNKIQVFSDFDGTITTRDTVDVLLTELADPSWEEVEEEWVQGRIGSRECMAKQIPLIRGGWNKVREILDELTISEGFVEFVDWCKDRLIPVAVVSDGLDRVIQYVLDKHRIRVDRIYANHLEESASGEFSLHFSAAPRLAGCQSGVCKCQIAGQAGGYQTIRVVIGDGRSDFCWSKEADLLFAKSKLIDHCMSQGIPHNPFDNFFEVKDALHMCSHGRFDGLVFNKPEVLAPDVILPSLSFGAGAPIITPVSISSPSLSPFSSTLPVATPVAIQKP